MRGAPIPVLFRDEPDLTGHGRSRLRADALAIAAAGLAAADPAVGLRDLLRLDSDVLLVGDEPLELAGRQVVVLGAGKATIGMAAVLDELLGARIRAGVVVVKRGQRIPLRNIEVLEAAHPIPDAASLAGGLRLLELALSTGPEDLVLALITGGSSSLAIVPAAGISLEDKIAVNRLLLASGADIVAINNVRKHLSRIKGGLLGAACHCPVVNFSVSDVVGDPPDYFTDLTVPDRSTFAMAQEVCDRYGLWGALPRSAADRLRRADPGDETPKEIANVRTFVVANSEKMCAAAAAAAQARGYAPRLLTLELQGESHDAGRELARQARTAAPGAALIAGGETTVALGDAARSAGQGGPNQEAALAAAIELEGGLPACVLCLDSDGTDGPTEAAGGLVDDLTTSVAGERCVDLGAALAGHTSTSALAVVGDLVVTGSTGTNVNDLSIALRALPRS